MTGGEQSEKAGGGPSAQREWWLRLVVAIQAPSAVFPLLRDESDGALEARQEPILAVVFLAGIAGVLAAPVVGTLADPPDGSMLLVAAWAIFAGALYGFVALFSIGLLLQLASRFLGSRGSYRRSRHVLALASVPVALSLLLVWPVRLALYGGDVFRSGGSDHGSGVTALRAVESGFLLWSIVLLVLGVRAVHGWGLGRALLAAALALALPALAVLSSVLR